MATVETLHKGMESINTIGYSENLQRWLGFHEVTRGQRSYGFWAQSLNPESTTSASFCERGIRMTILVSDDILKGL